MTRYPPRCRTPIRLKEPECFLPSVTSAASSWRRCTSSRPSCSPGFHSVFGAVLGPANGWAWVLSIVGLTLVIRAALIPLFVKQIKSSRNMQLLQPKVKELQKKYGHDRERLAQETMALYKETGTNPFASCLPILLQMPIFLALFRLIDNAAEGHPQGRAHPAAGRPAAEREDLRCEDLVLVHQGRRQPPRADPGRRAGGRHDRDDVPDPAPADEQEHAGRRHDRSVRPAAEDAALRAPRGLRGRRHRLPDRRALLLDDLEPVDDVPAVLRDPQQPGARHAGRQGQAGARRGEAQAQGPARPGDPDRAHRGRAGRPRRRPASSPRSRPAASARRPRRPVPPRSRPRSRATTRHRPRSAVRTTLPTRATSPAATAPDRPSGPRGRRGDTPDSADPARPTGSTP